MPANAPITTGFIGLGAMGAPMARNLHQAGHLAAVWNRTAGKAEALAKELGVTAAASPADLAGAVDLVITCVSADADLLAVVDALAPGLKTDAVVVDCSTVSAQTAEEAARRIEEHGGHFLDAPVSGGVEGARAGTLAMMVGGEADVLERVRPALESMARAVVHMGPVGSGQATKAVNQVMVAGINQAVTEALAFGEALGLDMAKVIELLSGGAAGNWFLQHRGPSMVETRFDPGFKLALHHKDLEICRAMAETVTSGDTRLTMIEMTLLHYKRLMEAGHGDEDISTLFRLKRGLFKDE
jgi:3-hydroxyisobutyrate dehydrogenase